MKRTIGIAVVLLIGATLTGCIGVKGQTLPFRVLCWIRIPVQEWRRRGRGWFPGRTVTSENGSWSFSKRRRARR